MFHAYYPALDHRRRSSWMIIPFLKLAGSESRARAARCPRVQARSNELENSLRKNGAFRLVVNGADVRSGTSRFELSSSFFYADSNPAFESTSPPFELLSTSSFSFPRFFEIRLSTLEFLSRNFI